MKIALGTYWEILHTYVRARRRQFALLAALVFGSIGLQIYNPQIMRGFLDAAKAGADLTPLTLAAVAFIVIALVQQAVAVLARYTGEDLAWNATNELRADLATHCLNLDMSFHNERTPGELIERIDGDVLELSRFFSQLVIRVIGNILLLAGILAVLFFEDYRVGLLYTAFAVTTLLALNRVREIAVPFQKAMRDAVSALFGFLEERLAGTEDIRSSGAVAYVMRGLFEHQRVVLARWTKTATVQHVVRITAGMMLMVGYAIALLTGYYLYRTNAITLGTVYLLVHYTNLLARPIRELTGQVENLQNIGASVERLGELQRISTKVPDGTCAMHSSSGPLSLELRHATFEYHPGEPVLHDLSFTLPANHVLGVLGRTGSGKTTVARLVFRLYDLKHGDVLLDGRNTRELRLAELRRRVAMVTQDVQLFQATVRENLTFFDTAIPDSRILSVIEELELGPWFSRLPNGLDTRLQTGGKGLSAGEAQLLAFTRVFLRDPGLVVLDEASSRLDPATEQLIERAVDRLLRNRTAIIIAHRLATVNRADDILLLDNGRAVEHGRRADLAADPASRFAALLRSGMEGVMA